jgi:hypothetical protein
MLRHADPSPVGAQISFDANLPHSGYDFLVTLDLEDTNGIPVSHVHDEARQQGEHGIGRSHHAAAPGELNRLATSATNHCLTGCVVGEVTGMMIATALGWGDVASIALAVALAFLFGYSLTSLPLVRARLPLAAIVPIALAADTVSIAIMELIDTVSCCSSRARWRQGSATSASGRRCSAASSSLGRPPSPSTGR